jgi:hypothetical protein
MSKLRSTIALALLALYAAACYGQGDKPLPDIPTLMRHVEAHQRQSEEIEKNYIFHQSVQGDKLDSHDGVKKSESNESEIFFLNGVQVRRLLVRDGKPLTPDELRKENDRLDKLSAQLKEMRDKKDAKGQETDARGHDEITLSRILELGAFSNPRREVVNGRDTIAVDYTGDPHVKTHNTAEGAFKELSGTVWVDEKDEVVQHLEAHFVNDFKVGGGIVGSVKKGTWFRASAIKINDEVWLPATFEAQGEARYLLFFSLHGAIHMHDSDYRKFKATSTILPAVDAVDSAAPPTP